MDSATHRVAECKASQDCGLWLRFDDGLEESALPGNLLVVRGFLRWRNVERFCRVEVDAAAATRVRDDGIRLDPENLYQDLLSGRPGNRFGSVGLAPSAE